ncbi:MAG TPA: phosphoenolpyruvate carboxykinase (ATP) [Eubacteriales bacterium]|nr:phosphoenolpyruvate carboxykinase (ATP) [Eubacteriales bacterium]
MKEYLESLGIIAPKAVYYNASPAALTELALARGEGVLADTGALVVLTGKYTGRSPEDRFIVDSADVHDKINWNKANVAITRERADAIFNKMTAYLQHRDVFVFDGYAGADPKYALPVRVINELASSALFVHNALIRPTEEQLKSFAPGFTVLAAPGFKCVPDVDGVHSEAAIVLDFEKKRILVAGSQYAGEIKKGIFTVMNFLMPQLGVLPMHCSANIGKGGDSALFFGLSGTGKTTLSADPNRKLVGDDEHGWTDEGIFNFEGGCYAKCINLSKENEPQIWNAIKFGALVENVVLDGERHMDFDDDTYTANTRAGYPVEYIPDCVIPGVGGLPKAVVFLTADAFGVIPPISKLDKNAAMYHFVSGYTSKLAGTERGVTEPQTTFSTLFGAPFMPMNPAVYAEMLGERIDRDDVSVFLLNTGWCGHKAGDGKRMSIKYTRAMLTAALTGELDKAGYELDPIFNVQVPKACPDVPAEVLSPRKMWAKEAGEAAYEATAKDLASRFEKNFQKYDHMPKHIVDAGPKA